MAGLSPSRIARTRSDEALFKMLSRELKRLLPPRTSEDLDAFVKRLRQLPQGLRAMAAVYELDVSVALDDLGWHFANWHHKGLACETLAGLRELEAIEEASIFERAFDIALAHWDFFGSTDFVEEYRNSDVRKLLDPLNDRLWRLLGYQDEGGVSLVDRWAPHARRYPESVCTEAV